MMLGGVYSGSERYSIMKIYDVSYVLENDGFPIKFLKHCSLDEKADFMKEFTLVDTIQEGLYEDFEEARIVLDLYNQISLHQTAPNFHVRKVNITYEI